MNTQTSSTRRELGKKGEEAAVLFLRRRGFDICKRNWICPAGEADIIAQNKDCLCFVEVKTRTNLDHGFPEDSITLDKRRRYERIAGYYISEHEIKDMSIRFDVISIIVLNNQRAYVRHHINAFGKD